MTKKRGGRARHHSTYGCHGSPLLGRNAPVQPPAASQRYQRRNRSRVIATVVLRLLKPWRSRCCAARSGRLDGVHGADRLLSDASDRHASHDLPVTPEPPATSLSAQRNDQQIPGLQDAMTKPAPTRPASLYTPSIHRCTLSHG